jgi:hypothetical protein
MFSSIHLGPRLEVQSWGQTEYRLHERKPGSATFRVDTSGKFLNSQITNQPFPMSDQDTDYPGTQLSRSRCTGEHPLKRIFYTRTAVEAYDQGFLLECLYLHFETIQRCQLYVEGPVDCTLPQTRLGDEGLGGSGCYMYMKPSTRIIFAGRKSERQSDSMISLEACHYAINRWRISL